jgi:hypothetical protein
MSKVSPVAKASGVGVDFMMGVLAKGLETTREAPENIGTAFKTIFARMREVTDIGKATEDGMSLNRVEKALDSIGIRLRDSSGQFRNLENVLTDVGEKWTTLTTIEQAYIATSLAGTRQQPRLLAIFNDFARTKELINISTEATGELAFQHMEYMAGAEAALSQLKTAWEGFIMAFTETELVIGAINGITDIINFLSNTIKGLTGNNPFAGTMVALSLVAIAYAGLTPKIAANTQQMIIEVQVTEELNRLKKENKALTTQQTLEVRKLTEEYKTATDVRRQEILKTLQSDHGVKVNTLSIKNLRGSFKTLTTVIYANIKAQMLAMVTQLITAGIMMLAGLAIAGLVALYKEATKTSADFAKEISQNNKQLKELSDKEKNVKKLTDRFDELGRKVVRTKEELNEMISIAEELSEVKVGDQTFQLARIDITGQATLDRSAYEAFVASVENQRQDLLTKNMDSFTKALVKDSTKAFEEFTITAMARDIGYGFSIDFLNGMKQGMTEDQISSVMQKLRAGINKVDPSLFANIQFRAENSMGSLESNMALKTYKDLMNGITTYEGMVAKLESRAAELGIEKGTERFEDYMSGSLDWIKRVTTVTFDEDKAKKFAEKFTSILVNASNFIESNTNKDSTLAQRLQASLDSYENAITEAESLSGSERTVMVKFLSESMQDEVILDTLTKGGVTIETIVKVIEKGTTLTGIADLIDQTTEKINKITFDGAFKGIESGVGPVYEQVAISATEAALRVSKFNDAITQAFGRDDYAEAYKKINEIFGQGSAEAAESINLLSNSLRLLNATTAATNLSDQGKLVQDLLKLPEQIEKGDFSKYGELVTEFGFDAVNSVLENGTANLDEFFAEEKEKFEKSINSAIANIIATRTALGGDLSFSEVEQIEQLELMLTYYEQIAGVEQLRAAVLKEVKDTVKETNDLYSLQEKLLSGGMSANDDFMEMLDKAIELSETNTLARLNEQIEDDIQSLNSLGVFIDGVFTKIADASQNDVNTGINKMIESITQLVDIQTAAYNRQKKMVEERYKEEIDAVKKANDEKWKQLDYNNKLVESEEQIINARRQLMGLALSGASRGEYQDAQKALEKLQQEREKTIESEIIDEAQKELEKQRDEELIAAQRTFTDAIKEYTDQLVMLSTIGERPDGTPIYAEQSVIDVTTLLTQAQVQTVEQLLNLDTSTIELTSTNRNLIIGLQSLTKVIDEWEVKFNSGNTGTANSADTLGT